MAILGRAHTAKCIITSLSSGHIRIFNGTSFSFFTIVDNNDVMTCIIRSD